MVQEIRNADGTRSFSQQPPPPQTYAVENEQVDSKDQLVDAVNTDLKALHDEAVRHQENPRLIRLIKHMMRLTNLNGEDDAEGEVVELSPPATKDRTQEQHRCPHYSIDRNGFCFNCGRKIEGKLAAGSRVDPESCLHRNILESGICADCGQQRTNQRPPDPNTADRNG